jgi:hypothetical protein
MRLHLLVGFVILGGGIAAAAAACGGETDTQYGQAGALAHSTPPNPMTTGGSGSGSMSSSSSGATSSSSSGGSGSSSGSSGGSGGGDGGAGSSSGGSSGSSSGATPACTVSWANQVYPALQNDGACGSSTACHASGGQLPAFLATATGTYNSFSQYTLLENKPYIKPGDTNPADSTIDCSLDTQTCYTTLPMPEAPGALTAADKTLIDTWVKCGAPNN